MPHLFRRLWHSWATRSLAVGAASTLVDLAVLLLMVHAFGWANAPAAMVGVTVGSTFNFFANRHFAFRDHAPELAPQAARFVVATGLAMLVHAGVVHLLADRWALHVVLAKLVADVCVFTFGQLLVLRYFIFPRSSSPGAPAQAGATARAAGEGVGGAHAPPAGQAPPPPAAGVPAPVRVRPRPPEQGLEVPLAPPHAAPKGASR
jgi:putative flippase GtrA